MRYPAQIQGNDPGNLRQFVETSTRFCALLKEMGIPFRPYASPELPHFSALGREKQSAILSVIDESISICQEAQASGERPLSSRAFLWRALQRLKMTPQSDIFDKIEDDDVVELYLSDFTQVFRTLNFFQFFSCTLEELVTLPMWQLVQYPVETLGYLNEISMKAVAGQLTSTLVSNHPTYQIMELVGPDRTRIEVTLKYFSPVSEPAGRAAAIVTNRSRIVGRG